MNFNLYLSSIFVFIACSMVSAQVPYGSERFLAFSAALENQEANADPSFGVFRTMESIRLMNPTESKGIQVKLIQPLCNEKTGAIRFINAGNEKWIFRLLNHQGKQLNSGKIPQEGISLSELEPGNYLIQFRNDKGLQAIDEVRIKPAESYNVSIHAERLNSNTTGVIQHYSCQAGMPENLTWDMGDGTSYRGKSEVSHSYKRTGTYIVNVNFENFDCQANATHTVVIQNPVAEAPDKE